MGNWDRIRSLAREFHAEVCASGEDTHEPGASAEVLLRMAGNLTGIRTKGFPKGHPVLRDALARFEGNTIIFDKSLPRWLILYHQAHEHGHIRLQHEERSCTAVDIDSEAAEDKLPFGVHRVEGYSAHERMECEANVFAQEFLLPCDIIRRWFIEEGLNATDIAIRVGDSTEMTDLVCHQLARALLTPDIEYKEEKIEDKPLSLDDSQRTAAEAVEGPLLVAAGPGTGKTRTLAGRVVHLLKNGQSPEAILVLTFSNKAAEELRERINQAAPDESQRIRIETFHSFGLELLRKDGEKIGLPDDPRVLDPVEALSHLEKSLAQLDLDHYENLPDPAKYLSNILKAISRAKDEYCSPARYQELAEAMLASQADGITAEKAVEVAQVYCFYQEYLMKNGLLDFGDLICRSIDLLRGYPQVREGVQQTYQHVLVDEYQDVNRASGWLLKEIVGEGEGLWAVGDIRQSIHRWRGATTANIRLFASDFPGAKEPLSLKINYRSQPPIVDTFSEFVPRMKATEGVPFIPWSKKRGDVGGTVKYEIAADRKAEAQGIARTIKQNVKDNIPYRKQAVLCRSHTSLARIARHLEEEEVPVLYLGDFFERSEVRDMLSLLSLACKPDGQGLLRVARFPEYNIPLADVMVLLEAAKVQSKPFPGALQLAAEVEGITPHGKKRLALVAHHLESLCHGKTAWMTLTRYLFVTSNYLRHLLKDSKVAGQQKRLALYQLLQFVHSQRGRTIEDDVDPKLSFLRYVRRLEIYGEERQLRQVPAWADGIDAVRLLTIHASKGLEFPVVFLPGLAKTYLPIKKSTDFCPPPVGMIADVDDWHQEEEECLFFVAMSRAQDHLFVSRAKVYGKSPRNPSEFLTLIENRLPRPINSAVTWPGDDATNEPVLADAVKVVLSELPVFDVRQLDTYLTCPRMYLYEFILGLSGKKEDTAYLQFHRCVYSTLRQIQADRTAGNQVSDEKAVALLAEAWKSGGPVDHPYVSKYHERATQMILNAVQRTSEKTAGTVATEHELSLSNGRVKFKIDYTEGSENGSQTTLTVQRFRTGKPTKSEAEKPIYGLYQAAAHQAQPKAQSLVQILYLSNNETQEVALKDSQMKTRLQKYEDAITSILQKRFEPNQSEYECPRCPHFFICPMAEDV
jgi:superfamily I DNA/RNA helicase/CRISPR/Cas system-associated exonuclease Cas4 (RecB family)